MSENRALSKHKVRQLLFHFSEDIAASKTAVLINVNRNTVNRYDGIMREKILSHQMCIAREKIGGEVEIDESYFGPKHVHASVTINLARDRAMRSVKHAGYI